MTYLLARVMVSCDELPLGSLVNLSLGTKLLMLGDAVIADQIKAGKYNIMKVFTGIRIPLSF